MPRQTEGTKWLGRKPKGFQDSNSFATFVSRSKTNKTGRAHLERNHGGFGL